MKKRDNQKMNMYAAVLQTCKDQQAAWENIPGFAAAVGELQTKLDELHQIHTEHDGAMVGVSANKNAFKVDLAEHIFVISKALSVKGILSNDPTLVLRNKINLSDLKGLSVNALLHRINALNADLSAYGYSLLDYGITEEFINQTQTLITEASHTLFQPRMAIIARKELTQAVSERTKDIDQLIKGQLDAFISSFKSSLPLFYKRYQNARLIVDYGHHNGTGSRPPQQRDDGVR